MIQILSAMSIKYKILLWLIIIVIIERVRQKVKPYKIKENNQIEIKSVVAWAIVMFWGLLFEDNTKDKHSKFQTLGLGLIITYNMYFIFEWTYLFICSFNFKNQHIKKGLEIYRYLSWKHKVKKSPNQQNNEENLVKQIKKDDRKDSDLKLVIISSSLFLHIKQWHLI